MKSYMVMNTKQRMLPDISNYFTDASASQSNAAPDRWYLAVMEKW